MKGKFYIDLISSSSDLKKKKKKKKKRIKRSLWGDDREDTALHFKYQIQDPVFHHAYGLNIENAEKDWNIKIKVQSRQH